MHLGISFIDALLDLSQLIVSAIEDASRGDVLYREFVHFCFDIIDSCYSVD